jgi:lysophospholipase L1-like esterase
MRASPPLASSRRPAAGGLAGIAGRPRLAARCRGRIVARRHRVAGRRSLAVAAAAIVAAIATPATASAAVLVVGDSLGVGTEPALRAALPGVQIDADSLNGRPSAAGLPILAELLAPEHDTVVFDLGTNDGNASVGVTAASLASARELAGDRCLVIATLNRPPLAGIPIDAQNDMIRRFAATTPNVALVDWNDAATANPGALRDDGVHASAAGYALRGALFADAIRGGCLSVGGGSGAGSGAGAAAPPTGGRAASRTSSPADRLRRARPSGPALEVRATRAIGDRLAADGGPLDLARHAAALVGAAATSLRDVLTPRGPEPVLGAE